MRTIQDYLKECDREKIINSYIYHHLFHNDLLDDKYKDITIGELKEKMRIRLNDLMDRLISLEPEDSGDDPGILMVRHSSGLYSTKNDDIEVVLAYKSEVMAEYVNLHAYAYHLNKHEKMLSYFVADTYLTQFYIDEVIEEFLGEALLMGPKQERLEDILNQLERSREEYKNGNKKSFQTLDEVLDELEEKYGFEREIKDERQVEAEEKLMQAQIDYDYLCKKLEIEKLRELLIAENKENKDC